MSRVSVLTPPGTGAIATIEVRGPTAWELTRRHFRPSSPPPLPESPDLYRVRFGRIADGDDVVLAVKQVEPETVVELHCHGGRRVVRWVVDRFTSDGCAEIEPQGVTPWSLLERAPTLKTASILLDQFHGAFDRAVAEITAGVDSPGATALLEQLDGFAAIGRHLVTPWKVVIAGAPNVGKSSLVNALAGYQRAVVSAVAGTTRDVVTVPVAFDGWPVELADTAGLRRAAESLESEGIALARQFLESADVVVWLIDGTDPVWPEPGGRPPDILAVNKSDLASPSFGERDQELVRISAKTSEGLPELIRASVRKMTGGMQPPPGAAVPFTAEQADLIRAALAAIRTGNVTAVRRLLKECCP